MSKRIYRKYRAELKRKAVQEYLSGKGSLRELAKKYQIGDKKGFWGILKSEMYYLRKFTDGQELISAIEKYIYFYNTKRYQKRLRCMTPMEFHAAA